MGCRGNILRGGGGGVGGLEEAGGCKNVHKLNVSL